MTRKEIVYETLKRISKDISFEDIEKGFFGFEAMEISDLTKIERANVSRELNNLVKEEKVIKILGRPVYFVDKEILEEITKKKFDEKCVFESFEELRTILNEEKYNEKDKDNDKIGQDPFKKIIGAKGSLELSIKQAKAAILYPPRGLHTLITGPTGVGKTTFAELMYKYALLNGRIKKNAELVIFNCSEYAENPQLILSQLFGHMKGAFTGADKDKAGLIEKADGGIILLDEIHRLSPEGQEMLFLLMDKNKYRRLGETESFRKANVLIIGATTEDIGSTLLRTFLRRIPVVIKLPSLYKRPITERFELIVQFFKDEVGNVKVPIKVYKNVMEALLLYDCQGNIGQLKADIQLLCARGFLEFKTFNKEEIEIDTPLLPDYIYSGLLDIERRRNEIIHLMKFSIEDLYLFTDYDKEKIVSIDNYKISDNLYREITEKYNDYLKNGYSLKEINEIISCEIERYLKNLLKKSNTEKGFPEKEELFKIVSPRIYNAVIMAVDAAEKKLNKKFNDNMVIGLTLHFGALIERLGEGKLNYSEEINQIVLNNPEEFKVARLMMKIVEEELGLSIPLEEVGFLTMFLTALSQGNNSNKRIGCIVLSHGNSTATSMAAVVNELLGTNFCKAVDMPLDARVQDVLEKTTQMVKAVDEGKGVILLVDMGSLTAFSEIITQKTGIETYSIEMVSTPLVLEVVRKCMLPEMTLKKLTKELDIICPYIGRNVIDNMVEELNTEELVIVTVCITGQGSAIKIANLIENNLPTIKDKKIELVPLNMNEVNNGIDKLKENSKKILAIVGSMNPKVEIPFISVDEIVLGKGLEKLNNIIFEEEFNRDNVKSHNYFSEEKIFVEDEENMYIEILERVLVFLNPIKTYTIIKATFDYIVNKENIPIDDCLKVSYVVHCSCMIERIFLEEPLYYKEIDILIQKEVEFYNTIKKAMEIIEQSFSIYVPDTEIGYIIDLFNTHKYGMTQIG